MKLQFTSILHIFFTIFKIKMLSVLRKATTTTKYLEVSFNGFTTGLEIHQAKVLVNYKYLSIVGDNTAIVRQQRF